MRYIVKMIIDRWPVGTDVTDRYRPELAQLLVNEGYLDAVDDSQPSEPEPAAEEDGG